MLTLRLHLNTLNLIIYFRSTYYIEIMRELLLSEILKPFFFQNVKLV